MMSVREKVKQVIQSSGSKFCTIKFRKKDTSLRRILIQPAVCFETRPNHPNLVTVYATREQGYKTINLDTVEEVAVAGEKILFHRE